MEAILTFELELAFPAELEPEPPTLMETISEAIREYDYRRRLLPGYPLPRGGERLTGISVALTKVEHEIDRFGIIKSLSKMTDPPKRTKSEPTQHAIIDLSSQIDRRIEELREAQARLWTIYDELWKATSAPRAAAAEQQAKRAMTSASEFLAGKAPIPKRSRSRLYKSQTE